ncbi:MAG: DNA repair exonuclease [Magnetococcales bacterium]|nr:DNA repair exonuclease [Magnetococcales bacterium]MBF0321587.1 DNA repair exonuclease [Magnetococcales bacterium]
MKFIHCADIHLDSPFARLAPRTDAPHATLVQSTRRAFSRLIDRAIEEPVDFVLIAGDLYDGDWRDFNTGLFFSAEASRLNRAHIPIYLLHGNHDAASQISRSLPLPPNVHLFSHRHSQSYRLDALRVALHGMSFGTRAITTNLVPDYPPPDPGYFNIGLLHTAASGREGHEPYAPCTIADLVTKGYDYWALGHIHTRELIQTAPHIVFPGNIQGRNIRETGPKGFNLVTVQDGRVQELHFIPVDLFRWEMITVEMDGIDEPETALAMVEQACRNIWETQPGHPLCLRIQFRGKTPLHSYLLHDIDTLLATCQAKTDLVGEGIWIEKVQVTTQPLPNRETLPERRDEAAALLRAIREVADNPSALTKLLQEYQEMLRHLPPDARLPAPQQETLDQEEIRLILDEAMALLEYRIVESE